MPKSIVEMDVYCEMDVRATTTTELHSLSRQRANERRTYGRQKRLNCDASHPACQLGRSLAMCAYACVRVVYRVMKANRD